MKPIRRLLARLNREWSQSIRRQLAWSFSLASLALILVSGTLLFSFQRDFLYAQGTGSALDLARTISFSSVSWVLADDLAGLQEVVQGTSETTDLNFAAVLSTRGEVLASTRPEYVGQYLNDAVSRRLLGLPAEPQVLLDETNLIDVAMPIKAGSHHIGWARVELTRATAHADLHMIAAAGLGIVAFLVLMITLVATRLARSLTSGLNRLASVADDAEHGRPFQRRAIERADELGVLERHLYRMLEAIEAEKKAKFESEARFRRLVKVVPVPLCYVSKEGVIEDFNDRFALVFGYTHEDIPTMEEWWRLAYPDEGYRRWVFATWNAAVEAAAESGQDIQPVEYRVTSKNGDVHVMEISGVTLGNDFLATFIDVTARKQSEEVIQASAQYARSLIEASLDPFVTISAEGKITDANTATERVTGVDRAGLIDSDFADYFTDPGKAREGYRQVFSQGFVTDYPLAIRHVSGKVTDVLYNASLYRDGSGNVLGVFAAARDVTELKRAEAIRTQLAAIVESSSDAIIGKTPDGIITSWNKGAEKMYGYTADEIIGQPVTVLAPPSSHAEVREFLDRTHRGREVANYESERIRKDGQLIHVSLTLSPIMDATGTITGVSTIARDVTDRKRVEAELKRSNAELEQFAYAISHDMRQPLRMVSSYLQLIEKALHKQLDDDTRQYLAYAQDGARRMDSMILGLLNYSRVGRKSDPMAPLEIRAALDEALGFLGPELSASGGTVEVSGDWPLLVASRDEMVRLFQNLVGNALKYHEEGRAPRVEVDGRALARAWRCEVRDQGVGIDPGQVDRLFKVFARLQSRARFDGSGVGLALCRKIVEHHGGRIGVESEGEGKGSTFWFELPSIAAAQESGASSP